MPPVPPLLLGWSRGLPVVLGWVGRLACSSRMELMILGWLPLDSFTPGMNRNLVGSRVELSTSEKMSSNSSSFTSTLGKPSTLVLGASCSWLAGCSLCRLLFFWLPETLSWLVGGRALLGLVWLVRRRAPDFSISGAWVHAREDQYLEMPVSGK